MLTAKAYEDSLGLLLLALVGSSLSGTLSKTLYPLLGTGSTKEGLPDMTEKLLTIKNKTKIYMLKEGLCYLRAIYH